MAPGAADPTEATGASDGDGRVRGAGLEAVVEFRKIVRNARLSIVAEDSEAAFAAIEDAATAAGGYVAEASMRSAVEQPEGTIVVRVPAERLDEVIAAVEDSADRVQQRAITTSDRTDEYTDTAARLRNLRALERELLVLLQEVRARPDATPDDILTVYDRINPVREQIEQFEARLAAIDELVALSTLTVEVSLPPSAAVAPDPEVAPPTAASVALRRAWNTLLRSLQVVLNAVIWLGVFVVPFLVVVVGPIVLAAVVIARWRRDRSDVPPTPPTSARAPAEG